ncbi:MAG: multidrug resistance efflux transporter family protein [Magnetospirillum sp.]|nr:multidrug resistance efflux transporter family protein [Magnetospirillum sp.]
MTSVSPAAPPPSMPRLLGLGLLAAALFSVTFVLNRAMSLEGGHWAWSAALRYVDMAVLLGAWLILRHGIGHLLAVLRNFVRRMPFWLGTGGIGFGVFYACCCFAADHAPGWIVAATWQVTILVSPLVLRGFGLPVPRRGIAFLLVTFLGIAAVNGQRVMEGVTTGQMLFGVIPVLAAAVAYPVGNQLLNRARHQGGPQAALLADPATAVLLPTLGALPFFAALLMVTAPPPPTAGQVATTAVVALFAGCLATALFLHARNRSNDPYRIAAVDATQAGEVGFALVGEMLLLGAAAPSPWGWLGLLAVTAGLIGFALDRKPA